MTGLSCRGLWVIIPLSVEVECQQPTLPHPLISKAHSAWGISEEPGHPAAKPSPDQRRTPPCSWLRMWSVHLSSPHPCPGNMYSHVCARTGIHPLWARRSPRLCPSHRHTRDITRGTRQGLGLMDLLAPRLVRPWGRSLEAERC